MTSDQRMTWDLIFDVLDRHGYHRRDNQHTGHAVGMILDLTRVYEGSLDHPFGPYINEIPPSRAEPAPPEPAAQKRRPNPGRRGQDPVGRPGHSRRLQTRPCRTLCRLHEPILYDLRVAPAGRPGI